MTMATSMKLHPKDIFDDEDQLRTFVGTPAELASTKAIDHLDKYCIAFIERSPFVILGTANKDGKGDVSPRGDQAGFVNVIDSNTLFIPERPGNKRIDTLCNIIQNPNIGMLFLIPGFDDCLRANGKATVIKDKKLLETSIVNQKLPKMGILISVELAMLHCAKAIRRSNLWDDQIKHDRSELPSIGQIILEQTSGDREVKSEVIKKIDARIETDYKERLY